MNTKYIITQFLIGLFLTPTVIFAQSPVLTNLLISPIAGESYSFHYIVPTDVGTAGENQVWDFSGLTSESDAPLMYITTEETMHASYFPGANVSSADGNMCMFEFYAKENDRLSYVGIYMDGLIMFFDDNKDALHYPFSYGDQFTDTFSTTYEQGTTTHHRVGTITAEADAYGTLMLPWGTLDDVLRVKTIEEKTDTFTFDGTPYQHDYYFETYAYYKLGIREPVLEFEYSIINEGDTVLVGHYINETTATSIVNFEEGDLKLFPNPVINTLNIQSKTTSPIQYCSITDLEGRLVWEDKQPVLPGIKIMDVSFLDSGVYFLTIHSGEEKLVEKFVKE